MPCKHIVLRINEKTDRSRQCGFIHYSTSITPSPLPLRIKRKDLPFLTMMTGILKKSLESHTRLLTSSARFAWSTASPASVATLRISIRLNTTSNSCGRTRPDFRWRAVWQRTCSAAPMQTDATGSQVILIMISSNSCCSRRVNFIVS